MFRRVITKKDYAFTALEIRLKSIWFVGTELRAFVFRRGEVILLIVMACMFGVLFQNN